MSLNSTTPNKISKQEIKLNSDFSALMPNSLDDMKTLAAKNGKLRTLLIQASEKISELVRLNFLISNLLLNLP